MRLPVVVLLAVLSAVDAFSLARPVSSGTSSGLVNAAGTYGYTFPLRFRYEACNRM